MRLPAGRLRIVDSGYGQGLACALLLDHFGNGVIERIDETVLIEPSTIALARAKLILLCHRQDSRILDLSVKLDEITSASLTHSSDLSTTHLLSNVLAIDDFDYGTLFTKMLRITGRHSVLALSHERNFRGASARFHDIENQIYDLRRRDNCTVTTSEIVKYNCSNGQPAISWQLNVEVLNGSL